VAPQDCGLGCCLACGTPVGSGSRFGRRGCGLLSPEVVDYGRTYCRDGEKSFCTLLSWLGRSSSSATDTCVSSFCALAGFSVCNFSRCEACDEVTIDGLSVELASVKGSFSAFSSLFSPEPCLLWLQRSHCCTLRCVRKAESMSYSTGTFRAVRL